MILKESWKELMKLQTANVATVRNWMNQMNIPISVRANIFNAYKAFKCYKSGLSTTKVCNHIRATKDSWWEFKKWIQSSYPEYFPTKILGD